MYKIYFILILAVLAAGEEQNVIEKRQVNDPETMPSFDCKYKDGLHAHPTDCWKFINCNGEANIAYVQSCPEDLYFCDETQRCRFPFKVSCKGRNLLPKNKN